MSKISSHAQSIRRCDLNLPDSFTYTLLYTFRFRDLFFSLFLQNINYNFFFLFFSNICFTVCHPLAIFIWYFRGIPFMFNTVPCIWCNQLKKMKAEFKIEMAQFNHVSLTIELSQSTHVKIVSVDSDLAEDVQCTYIYHICILKITHNTC